VTPVAQADFRKLASRLPEYLFLNLHYYGEQSRNVPFPAAGMERVQLGSIRGISCGSEREGVSLLRQASSAREAVPGGRRYGGPQDGLAAHRSSSSKSVGLGASSVRRSRRSARRSASCVTPAYRVLVANTWQQKADGNVCLFLSTGSVRARLAVDSARGSRAGSEGAVRDGGRSTSSDRTPDPGPGREASRHFACHGVRLGSERHAACRAHRAPPPLARGPRDDGELASGNGARLLEGGARCP
jgi:hypothetical protein